MAAAENALPARARILALLKTFVLSQEDAPAPKLIEPCATLSTENDIIVSLIFPYWKLLFLIPVFNYIQKPCCEFC